MNLTEMYLNSPDWLKLIWIISPYLTLYALGRIWAKHWVKPVPKAEVEELQWVEVERDMDLDREKGELVVRD